MHGARASRRDVTRVAQATSKIDDDTIGTRIQPLGDLLIKTTPSPRCRSRRDKKREKPLSNTLLSPVGFNRMGQKNAGAEQCNQSGRQLKHGNSPCSEMSLLRRA
jgi:hypothetical protein